jgi:hypothetical protein
MSRSKRNIWRIRNNEEFNISINGEEVVNVKFIKAERIR